MSLAGIECVHADPWLCIVNKPAGWLCQPGLGPGQADALIGRLQRDQPELRLVHRLDRDTSGLLLLARSPQALRSLSQLFEHRLVQKLYVADVLGRPAGVSGRLSWPLARLERSPPRYGPHPQGRASLTCWRLAEACGSCSRLWLRPRTGRSHQLRAHCASFGLPILGDPIYGADSAALTAAQRLHLHAAALAFRHPFTGQRLRVRSAVPFPCPPD
ncbi:RIuA family pseudouridine synthase [Synechococcus sp. WH 8101]|uniref:RluA family pseudouridine synthase n=1 Tax=Synechococcus sp. WH 8101 TaxID=59932 RepID=UPI001023E25B|nr:RluA family pseudouridine synthase [Synechococcus sp. WH 8101]QBE68491.1 RIuA family pseudouridine synthase [Synechococcus sp. WH 8101]QNI44705.1 ribosomal large subunit pseudouridine synthase A [Synechococcus sp. WH 8101]